MMKRSRPSLVPLVFAVASLAALDTAPADIIPWKMRDGKIMKLELRDAWGEDEAAMVEFITPDMKLLTLKRDELHPDDQKRIRTERPRHEDFRFAWAAAKPADAGSGETTITYRFERTLPGIMGCNESTLNVAPFRIGSTVVPSEAWKVVSLSGPDGAIMEFRTTGRYDFTKLSGTKFSASLEVEAGKDRRRTVQRIDFPGRPMQEVKARFGEIELTSFYGPAVGDIPARYGVLVRAEPKEKLIRYLVESNGRTAGLGGMEIGVAGTFATVKIDYWESFEKTVIQFSGTAGQPQAR